MTMTSQTCNSNGSCHDTDLGFFPTPATNLAFGKNRVKWDVGVTLLDASSLLNSFILPLLSNQTVTLKLSAEDVSMLLRFTVLPLPFKRLKLEKKLSCKLIGQTGSHVIPEKFCHKADTEGQGYSIRCLPSSTEIIV